MKKRSIILAGVFLSVTAAIFLLLSTNSKKVNNLASLDLKTIEGKEWKLNDFHGQPVLVTFWASSCSGCIKEMPHLISLYQELNGPGLEIIAIAMPYDPPNRVLKTVKQKQIPYPVALDINGIANHAFGDIAATPTSFLISPNGDVIEKYIGEMHIKSIREKILGLLQTAENS